MWLLLIKKIFGKNNGKLLKKNYLAVITKTNSDKYARDVYISELVV